MKLRIATFNLENLDDQENQNPSLEKRIKVLRPQLLRLKADVICFQEIQGQETVGEPRDITALKELLKNTPYEDYNMVSTKTQGSDEVYDKRNLVIVSKYSFEGEPVQVKNSLLTPPSYNYVTDTGADADQAKEIKIERPIFYVKIRVNDDTILHVINLHLKSRNASNVTGQKINQFAWRNSSAWAEGYFVSSMKRVAQSIETRMLIDSIFEENPNAKIVVCGDFNAHPKEVPVEAIAGKVANTGNSELNQFEMVACENTIPESSRYTYIYRGQKRLIDHILISKALMPFYRTSEIHNETLEDESVAFALDSKFPESDHAPFIIELELESVE
ncbi:endonuclease/exonuclease/phosphatase family protein [Croceitalea rosinachiae]|uniref:Endonuclease/exonuclease/phosphatase family protein n=1 Tax=Croceitalea rosinachiae TaxID=3075596 RepID=A0ABU3AH80_9FLAO|nr:endonuclease/exonuclease/phosphatase family protein [Croceitalea sp. F388]MDT0608458.1 endonuclease/exonuclease/phosphatase family protein [Croceitalea sp. F388]